MKSVILLTGAGTGIGKLSAQALAEAGHIVYATMRDVKGRNKARADALRTLAEQKGIQLHPLELDILSQESADAAAATIVREQGRIDVVMQNAGHLVVGPSEAFTPEEMMKVFDTNLCFPTCVVSSPGSYCGSAVRRPRAAFLRSWVRMARPRPRWIRWR
jgi:NAD(P)-dependent dehydrogenase (short-subunit alcohol dehydrogenase family)